MRTTRRLYSPRLRFALYVFLFATLLSRAAAPAYAQVAPQTAEAEFAEAFKLYADQLYAQAIHAFQAFRDGYPDHINTPEALYYQGESALALGRDDEAVRLFEVFERRYPVHPLALQATLALGKYFYEAGDYDRSIQTLDRLLERNPPAETAAKALYLMGEGALQAGRTEEGLAYFQRAADDYPDTETAPIALFTRAYTEVQLERLDDAARTFEVLATRYPNTTYARDIGLALAETYYELENYQRVVAEIQSRMPDLQGETLTRAEFLLAEAYNHLRDSQNAILHYRPFAEGDPNSPYYRPALYGLAWNYYLEEAYEWAAESFAQARAGHDDEIAKKSTYYEAASRRLLGQSEEAIALWAEYLERWPDGELADHALHESGLAQYDLRMWEEANETFARLIRDFPESDVVGDAYFRRGNTFIALGEFDEALDLFDRAIALEAAPASLRDEVTFQKAWLLHLSEDYARSAPALLEVYEQRTGEAAGEALFWAAEGFYQLGELDEAKRLFRTYLEDFRGGEHVDAARYALAWVHFRQGQYGEAITYFQRFLDQYHAPSQPVPYRTDAMLRMADSYYALKQYQDAIRTYSQVVEEGGEYALYQVGQAYSNAGRHAEAVETFRRLLREFPGGDWAEESQYKLGELYFQDQQYDQSIAEYQTLLEQWPRHPLAARAQYGIGDALYNAGRLNEAIEAYQVVLEQYPESSFAGEAASSIQYALISQGSERQANQILEDFARENPDSPVVAELRFRKAEVLYQSGRNDEALAALKEYVSQANDEQTLASAYYYMADILVGQREYSEAEAYLQRIMYDYEDSARRIDAARLLGRLYMETARPSDALDTYRSMKSMAEGNPRLLAEARYGEAMALIELGSVSEAEELLQEALRADANSPTAAPALLGLARLYERQNRASDALALYSQVVNLSRDETGAEALYRLGTLLLSRGEAEHAVEELSRMPVLFPDFPEWLAQGYLAQARAFQALGRTGDAAQVYDRVIQEYGDSEYAEVAAQEKAEL